MDTLFCLLVASLHVVSYGNEAKDAKDAKVEGFSTAEAVLSSLEREAVFRNPVDGIEIWALEYQPRERVILKPVIIRKVRGKRDFVLFAEKALVITDKENQVVSFLLINGSLFFSNGDRAVFATKEVPLSEILNIAQPAAPKKKLLPLPD